MSNAVQPIELTPIPMITSEVTAQALAERNGFRSFVDLVIAFEAMRSSAPQPAVTAAAAAAADDAPRAETDELRAKLASAERRLAASEQALADRRFHQSRVLEVRDQWAMAVYAKDGISLERSYEIADAALLARLKA